VLILEQTQALLTAKKKIKNNETPISFKKNINFVTAFVPFVRFCLCVF